MLRRPPEILVTTPESLNLLLSSPRARGILTGPAHGHPGRDPRRGLHQARHAPGHGGGAAGAAGRGVPAPGPFGHGAPGLAGGRLRGRVRAGARGRRRPARDGGPGGDRRRRRGPLQGPGGDGAAGPAGQAAGADGALSRRPRRAVRTLAGDASIWPALVASCRQAIHAHRSTLLFTNTRRHAEKLARLINEAEGAILAYAHHGSLSREIRAAVESRLKRGELKAIVATSSLELGIDIGELDQVLLIQTPLLGGLHAAAHRPGRSLGAGGQPRRAAPPARPGPPGGGPHGAGGAGAGHRGDPARALPPGPAGPGDPVHDGRGALGHRPAVRRAARQLPLPRAFPPAVRAGAGHAGRPLRRLPRPRAGKSRVPWTGWTIPWRPGAAPWRHVYRSGGTIPDRGYFDLRTADSRAKIGELDEEFVWERRVGDTFMLGTQGWRIRRIDARSVEVTPWDGTVSTTVFWKAERGARDFRFCERVGEALERWNPRLADPQLPEELRQRAPAGAAGRRGSAGLPEAPAAAHARGPAAPPSPAAGKRARSLGGGGPAQGDPAHPVGGAGERAPGPGPGRAVGPGEGPPPGNRGRRRLHRRPDAGGGGPGAASSPPAPGGPGRPAAARPGVQRLFRGPLPRERGQGPAPAALGLPPPGAAVADPPALQEAAGSGARLRRLPGADRDLAGVSGGRVRPGRRSAACSGSWRAARSP